MPNANAAPWKKENAALREDPTYTKQWVVDPNRRGAKNRKWAKGEAVDRVQELDDRASKLRALYKRPRFGWKEVMQDDLRSSVLSEDLPAIGSGEVWLSKFLSHCGVCSRRRVSEMVLQGRVAINGEVCQSVTVKVDPAKDVVTFDGQPQKLRTLGELVWIMLNKPKGYICTMEDESNRRTIMDLVPFAKSRRLVPVGRIDRNAAGLMLLTNDYEWHTILAHPRHNHVKRYKVQIYNGVPNRDKMQALRTGLELPDERRPLMPLEDIEVGIENKVEEIATLRFNLTEGKYRQIRRMFEYIGHPVKSIKRIQFGLLKLDRDLKPGEWRQLRPKEIRRLKGSTILPRPTKHPYDEQREQEMQMREQEQEMLGGDKRAMLGGRRGGERGNQPRALGGGRSRDQELSKDSGSDRFGSSRGRDGPRDSSSGDRGGFADRLNDYRRQYTAEDRKYDDRDFDSSDYDDVSDYDDDDDDGVDYDDVDYDDTPRRGSREPASQGADGQQDWENSWVEQLDAMQAEKSSAQPPAGMR